SAGRDEAAVRRRLVETGDVDVMVAIRGNFFYTRTVPCELWFIDKDKASLPSPPGRGAGGEGAPARGPDTVLMLDARNVYRKVTRKIFDFSPEQLANLTSIVWLYRGQSGRFLALVRQHLLGSVTAAQSSIAPLHEALAQMRALASAL